MPYNSYDVSLENLVLDQLNISLSLFPLYSHHLSAWYCIDIVRRTSLLVTHGIWGVYRYKSFSASFLVRTNNSFELWAKSKKHWWQLQSIRISFFLVNSLFFPQLGRIWEWGRINPITANDKVETHAKKGPFSLDPTPHFSPLTLHSGCGSPLKQERWHPFCRLQNQWQIFQFLLHWREVPSTITILKLWYILSWKKKQVFVLLTKHMTSLDLEKHL